MESADASGRTGEPGLDMPDLSVVVPTYNRREGILRLLRALEGQSLPTERFEVVVYAPLLKGQPPCEQWGSIEIRRVSHVTEKLHKAIQLFAGQLRTRTP